jgi:excisionase family DNA binding protein
MTDVANSTGELLADYLTQEQVADELGVSVKTLRSWRALCEGPPCTRLGPRLIRFHRTDVAEWLASRKQAVAA